MKELIKQILDVLMDYKLTHYKVNDRASSYTLYKKDKKKT